MGFFHKKKDLQKTAPVESAPVCTHKWRDFDWYMDTTRNMSYKSYRIKIIEPYVCVICKERKDVVLYSQEGYYSKATEVEELKQQLQNKYREHLKPGAIVEDQVNDAIMVDREFIDAWDKLHASTEKQFIDQQMAEKSK